MRSDAARGEGALCLGPTQVREYSVADPLTHGITRGDWLFDRIRERGVPLGTTLLDVGCGYGGLSLAYARSGRCAIAVDIDPSNLGVVASRMAEGEAGDGRVRVVQGSALGLPVGDGTADLALMIGVLEWVGYSNLTSTPQATQVRALQEVTRALRPGGHLVIGTKNRLFPRYVWSDAQCGRPILNVLPRRWADFVSRSFWRLPYRGRIQSLWGWRRLFRSAGLKLVSSFVPVFNYQFPLLLADPWSARSIGRELDAAARLLAQPLRYAAVDIGRPGRATYYRVLSRAGLLGLGGGTFLFVCRKPLVERP
jgi:SAM-dependent methyltransferase